jgi:hypothetical protein
MYTRGVRNGKRGVRDNENHMQRANRMQPGIFLVRFQNWRKPKIDAQKLVPKNLWKPNISAPRRHAKGPEGACLRGA